MARVFHFQWFSCNACIKLYYDFDVVLCKRQVIYKLCQVYILSSSSFLLFDCAYASEIRAGLYSRCRRLCSILEISHNVYLFLREKKQRTKNIPQVIQFSLVLSRSRFHRVGTCLTFHKYLYMVHSWWLRFVEC